MLNLQHDFVQFQKKVGSNHSTMILKHPTVMGWFCPTLSGKWQKPVEKLGRSVLTKTNCREFDISRLFTNSSWVLSTLKSCHRQNKRAKFWWKMMKVFAPSQVTADSKRARVWVASGLFLPTLLLFVVAQQLPRHLVSGALLFLFFLFQAVTKKRGL